MVSGLGLPCPRFVVSRSRIHSPTHTPTPPIRLAREARQAGPAPPPFIRSCSPPSLLACLSIRSFHYSRCVYLLRPAPPASLHLLLWGAALSVRYSYKLSRVHLPSFTLCFPADCSNSPQMYLDLRASVRATSPSRDPNAPSLRVLLRTACANTTLCHIPPSQSDSIGRVCAFATHVAASLGPLPSRTHAGKPRRRSGLVGA